MLIKGYFTLFGSKSGEKGNGLSSSSFFSTFLIGICLDGVCFLFSVLLTIGLIILGANLLFVGKMFPLASPFLTQGLEVGFVLIIGGLVFLFITEGAPLF